MRCRTADCSRTCSVVRDVVIGLAPVTVSGLNLRLLDTMTLAGQAQSFALSADGSRATFTPTTASVGPLAGLVDGRAVVSLDFPRIMPAIDRVLATHLIPATALAINGTHLNYVNSVTCTGLAITTDIILAEPSRLLVALVPTTALTDGVYPISCSLAVDGFTVGAVSASFLPNPAFSGGATCSMGLRGFASGSGIGQAVLPIYCYPIATLPNLGCL